MTINSSKIGEHTAIFSQGSEIPSPTFAVNSPGPTTHNHFIFRPVPPADPLAIEPTGYIIGFVQADGTWFEGNAGDGNEVIGAVLDIETATVYGAISSAQESFPDLHTLPFRLFYGQGTGGAITSTVEHFTNDFPAAQAWDIFYQFNSNYYSRNGFPEIAFPYAFFNTPTLHGELNIIEVGPLGLTSYNLLEFSTQNEADAFGNGPALNDGTLYYLFTTNNTALPNALTLAIAEPRPFGTNFVFTIDAIQFDDPTVEAIPEWQAIGHTLTTAYFVSADMTIVIAISYNGEEYIKYNVTVPVDTQLTGFMFYNDRFYGSWSGPVTSNLLSLIIGSTEGNYTIKDAIRLGCWSPCINVGYKEE